MSAPDQIQVREYEYLTRLDKRRPGCHDLTNKQFSALREFVLSNLDDSSASPCELMHLCSPPGIGEAFQLRNYVGVVELADGLQIEILPKIEIAEGMDCSDQDVFLKMLSALGTDYSFKSFDGAHVGHTETTLFEVFISMFVDEATKLVRAGLRSAYIETADELSFVKGRIDFSRMVAKGAIHAERLPVAYDEFRLDRPENRLIKTTLMMLRRRTHSSENARNIARLLPAFESVGISHNIDADLAKCVSNRGTKRYGMLLGWCRVFLKGQSFTMFRGRNVATALLFPMERVFEDYVGQQLRLTAIRSHAVRKVDLQVHTKWLFDNKRVSLRPDIVCERRDGTLVVLDTKWKRVSKARDLSAADMHQMYAYGRRYRADGEEVQQVILLYPWHKGVKPGLQVNESFISADGVKVDMFFVDLANMKKSMDELVVVVGGECSI